MSDVPLNPLDQAFVGHWKAQNFNTWNEADIREEFIAPLLKTLGYAKGTVNDILREESLTLNQSFHRIGRKRVDVDYVPTVRLKKFWIIEAKPGEPRAMDYGDLLQAHLYAVHPEIRANLIVVTNGWELRIFDTDFCDSWQEPLFSCTQQDCEMAFQELRRILGARELLTAARGRVLGQIEKSLEVEFDENVVKNLQQEFYQVINKARSTVQKNARELARQGFLERQKEATAERRAASFSTLLAMMNNPLDLTPPISIEVTDRITSAGVPEQVKMIDKLAMEYRGRPHSAFRVHCASIFARLIALNVNPPGTFYVRSVQEGLEELVSSNMNYWNQNDLSNALCHLDNATLRVAMKFCKRFLMKSVTDFIQSKRAHFAAEDLIKNPPSVAADMLGSVYLLSQFFWTKYSGASDAQTVCRGIWTLESLEVILDVIPSPEYPKGDGDLMWYDSYGKGFDCLRLGTWDVVRSIAHKLPTNIPAEVRELIGLDRQAVLESIPQPQRPPPGWNLADSDFEGLLARFRNA